METATPQKTLGNIKEITIKMTSPLKMEFVEMNYRQIMLMVGANGTGKTFVLCSVWLLAYITSGAVVATIHKQPFELKSFSQYALEHTFDEHTQLSGNMKIVFTSGATLDMLIESGIITYIDFDRQGVTDAASPIYMSSNMRLFNNIKLYLAMRKPVPGSEIERVHELLKTFKLYDVHTIERLISRCPIKITPQIQQMLEGFDIKEKYAEFGVDLDRPDFYIIQEDGEKKWMTSFGNGHQALFNMVMVNTMH